MLVDGCGYTFTLDGQKSWWGETGSEGRTAKCAANEDETWLRPWQYMYCTYQMFFLAAAGVKNTVSVFRWSSGTGEEKMDPDKSVVFAYDGVPAHLYLAFPARYVHSLCFPPRNRWKGFKLSESDIKGRHLVFRNLKMYDRNEGKALAIPLQCSGFGNNNCSAWSSAQKHGIVTAAKCVNGYHFMQTYLPKCLNSEFFEGYTFNGLKFRPNLFEFLLFNWKPIFVY